MVLVSDSITPPPNNVTNDTATVEITGYQPKWVALKTKAESPAVLLLNDRNTPHWQVRVDGKPGTLLRCNYLMRGVQLPAGEHEVEFVFLPDIRPLQITLAGLGATALIGLGLVFTRRKQSGTDPGRE
jgi:uncharacterized membrane protein YfhO